MQRPNHTWNRQGVVFCLSKIFTPAVWADLGAAAPSFDEHRQRWFLKPLCLAALFISLAQARTLRARFHEVREQVVRLYPKKVRPGEHLSGFQAALRSLPAEVLAALRRAMQQAVLAAGQDPARVGRHLCYGVDGTHQEAARTTANEAYFGTASQEPFLPQRLISTCFCLGQRLLWDWSGGAGNSSEPDQILEIIRRGPPGALYVKDAGTVGYDWFHGVLDSAHHLLMRVGGNFTLWAEVAAAELKDGGRVLVWPQDRREDVPPIALRLITYTRTYTKTKHDRIETRTERVHLLTDLPVEELTQTEAEHLFELRWPCNEIGHRGWKRILGKYKLSSERPENAEKESEFSLLGCMFLQVLALVAQDRHTKRIPSLAQALDVWHDAIRALQQGRSAWWLWKRLRNCVLDKYVRHSAKVKRDTPRRKEHKPLKPPILRQLDEWSKAKLATLLTGLGILTA
jgi:hypothetical protein